MTSTSQTGRARDAIALCGALAVLVLMLVLATGSCGNGDLVFPGNVPSTATGAPTTTATP